MRRAIPRRSVLAGLLASAALRGQAQGAPVHVFAAASLKTALDAVLADLPGIPVRATYAGSSILARQIAYGAPADLFLSANPGWMDDLAEKDMLAQRVDLLANRLVLIAGPGFDAELTITPGFDLAQGLGQGRLAMALTDSVPAGIYGRQALSALGVWDDVRPLVAQTDNVRAALRLVASGAAPLGVVYHTDALADPRVRVLGTFPSDSHAPIVYPAALLRGASEAGRAVWDHVISGAARDVFVAHGFLPPPQVAGDGS